MSEFDFPEEDVIEAFSLMHQKQKQVMDEDEFLLALNLSDDDEELDSKLLPRAHQVGTADSPFENLPFEVTADDLALFEAQEKSLHKENCPAASNTYKSSPLVRSKALCAPEMDHSVKLKLELQHFKDQADALQSELDCHRRQILTKEGEISILRLRLQQLDHEKLQNAQSFSEKTDMHRRELVLLEEKFRAEMMHLETELQFKDQELKSLASSVGRARKLPRGQSVPSGKGPHGLAGLDAEFFGEIKKTAVNIPLPSSSQPVVPHQLPNTGSFCDTLAAMSAENILGKIFQMVDRLWRFSDLDSFDALDIVKAKELALGEIQKSINHPQGRLLASALVKFMQQAVYLRQYILITYVSQVSAALFDWCGQLFVKDLTDIIDEDGTVHFYKLTCQLLTAKVLINGIPAEVIANASIALNAILYYNDMKIPKEYSASRPYCSLLFRLLILCERGFFQWILRNLDALGADGTVRIMGLLYSMSRDLGSISLAFLNADTDKVDGRSVLDGLLNCSHGMLDKLFPIGQNYRHICLAKDRPSLDPNENALLEQFESILSLLFSFVHRSLGPVTLWLPDIMIRRLALWTIELIKYDLNVLKTKLFLDPSVLLAQNFVLQEILNGFAAVWRNHDQKVCRILNEHVLPFAFAVEQISTGVTSFSSPPTLAAATVLHQMVKTDIEAEVAELASAFSSTN